MHEQTKDYSVATPVNWQRGGTCMVVPTLSEEEAKKKFKSYKTVEVPSGAPTLLVHIYVFFCDLLISAFLSLFYLILMLIRHQRDETAHFVSHA